jgi:hypothetical protein
LIEGNALRARREELMNNIENLSLKQLDEHIAFLQLVEDFMKIRKVLGKPVTREQTEKIIRLYFMF